MGYLGMKYNNKRVKHTDFNRDLATGTIDKEKKNKKKETKQVDSIVYFLTCIQEEPSLNLAWNTKYTE
jgi:hypothetical protein